MIRKLLTQKANLIWGQTLSLYILIVFIPTAIYPIPEGWILPVRYMALLFVVLALPHYVISTVLLWRMRRDRRAATRDAPSTVQPPHAER